MTSRGLTNEAYYAHQKVARFIGTNHVDTSARICHAPSTAGLSATVGCAATTCSYSDWIGADLIVLVGTNLANNQPVSNQVPPLRQEGRNQGLRRQSLSRAGTGALLDTFGDRERSVRHQDRRRSLPDPRRRRHRFLLRSTETPGRARLDRPRLHRPAHRRLERDGSQSPQPVAGRALEQRLRA